MKHFIGAGIFLIILSLTLPSYGAQKREYWIDGGREVLAFIGDPGSNQTLVVKLTLGEKQKVKLFHKKSGPGLYAFDIYGLVVKNNDDLSVLHMHGFFIAKKSWVRSTEWKEKISMKYKTR